MLHIAMSVEGVEVGVEVDSAYSSVAASWFGFTDVSNDCAKHDENEKNDAIPKNKRESGEVLPEVHVHVKEPEKHTTNRSSFIDEKLAKKLKKSKRKAEEKEEDEEKSSTNIKTQTPGDTDEDSKTAIIKKKNKPSHDTVPSHSIESLTKRLASGSLSQSTRKRLRKRLNKLIKESGANDTKTKSETCAEMPAKCENSSLSSSSLTSTENVVRESSPSKRKLEDDASKKEEESPPTKRKKKKKRSKQKNIKKDNRPDHLKPPHLRNNPTEMAPLSPAASKNIITVKEKVQIESGRKEPKMKNTKEKKRNAGSVPRKCIEDKDISESRPKKAKAKG